MNKQSANNPQSKYSKTSAINQIAAICIISESELAKVMDYSVEFSERPEFLTEVLYGLGINTKKAVIRQDGLQHRNRFGEIVVCSRWVGEERIDEEWINSGYASREAIDKATGSKILEDIYRAKYLTDDMQSMLEARDRLAVSN